MVDVIDSNFEEVLPILEHQLKKCSFVALDCEFTSLPFDVDAALSFQDSGGERYQKIRQTIYQCFPLQVGLSAFSYDRDLTDYKATIFKFNVCPRFFGLYDLNIIFKSSSVQFLRTYNFDFNKVFYHGISFLNKDQNKLVLDQIDKGVLSESIFKEMTFDEREALASHCETINTWLNHTSVGESLTIQVKANSPHVKYFLHKEIRKRFKNVWTFHSNLSSPELTVKNVSKEERHTLESTDTNMEDEFLTLLRGFSRVLDALVRSKKPLVGHNMLLDLLSCYHHYCAPLPSGYQEFKTNLNSLFPVIYDTKFISHEMKRMEFRDILDNISLQNLYITFQDTKDRVFKPFISLESGVYSKAETSSNITMVQHCHDAGWDAYMTGFCFIKMMHLLHTSGNVSSTHYSNAELMAVAGRFKNKINVGRAFIPYMQLDGPDPDSRRPPHLVVSCIPRSRLNLNQLDTLLLEVGNFEVKLLSPYSASVAAPNYLSYHDAVKTLRNTHYKVEKYSLLKHHKWMRSFFMVGCTILPASLTMWYYLKKYSR